MERKSVSHRQRGASRTKDKKDLAKSPRRSSGTAGRPVISKTSSSRQKSRPRGSRSRDLQLKEAGFGNPFRWLAQRIDRIDWRYKVQLTIGFGLAIIVATYLLRERISALGDWSYLGAFIVNGISNATIILPAPGGAVIAIMAQDFNPLLIGIAAGLGGTLGGSTAYVAGLINGRSARNTRWFRWLTRLMGSFGGIVIFTFALIPILPGDFASLAAGAVRYRFHKYLLYNAIGSMIKMTVIAYFGADLLQRLELIVREWLV